MIKWVDKRTALSERDGVQPKVNAKKILQEIQQQQSDRTKVSLYLSKSLYENFKKACGDAPASQVIEKMMQAFIESKGK